MAVRTRIQPISRDIELMLNETLSPAAQSAIFAEYAGEQIEEAKQINKAVLGQVPRYTVTVDGRQGAPLSSVRPDGLIVAEFDLQLEALGWIEEQLLIHSPMKSGRYRKSHVLFADGKEIEFGSDIPQAEEWLFINSQPYARKIERGSSSQAPEGVYQALATLAQGRFGNTAKITFTFRALMGGSLGVWASSTKSGGHIRNTIRRAEWLTRQPAIIVRPLSR